MSLHRYALVSLLLAAFCIPAALVTAAEPVLFSVTSREVFVPTPKTGVRASSAAYYVTATGLEMVSEFATMSRSDTTDSAYSRRSTDNGKTWSEPQEKRVIEKTADGITRHNSHPYFVDPSNGRVISFVVRAFHKTDQPLEAVTNALFCYQLSDDAGRTFYHDSAVIQTGAEYNEKHQMEGVYLGKNAAMIGDFSSLPIRIKAGEILMPLQIAPLGPDGVYYNPKKALTFHDSAVLIGKWNDRKTLDWELSARVAADPELSARGMLEPTIIEAPDGRILMVMRGSNKPGDGVQGYRWFAVSSDKGRTWTKPAPWTYTGGESFFSPSSCSRLIGHSSGQIFWIGNICPKNPIGNLPRYPLYIGRVDPQTLLLEKASLFAIDDRQPGDAPWMTLSNFYAYEDRVTKEIVVHYSPVGRAHPLRKAGEGHDWTADGLRVRVKVGS